MHRRIEKQSFLASSHFKRLAPGQAARLHEAALEILERTGARLHHPPAVDLLERAGAQVSEEGRVRIPSRLVEQALRTVPKEVTLYNRNGEAAIHLSGEETYFGPGSDCLNILDHRTGERRKPVVADIADGMILCDALDNIDFVMCMFLPFDVPTMAAERYQMMEMLKNTTKPIIFVATDLEACMDAVEMAEIVAGGPGALGEHPSIGCYINVVNGLQHNPESLQKLIYLAERGLPAAYVPVALGGVSAPVTLAGNMAIWHAGCLVGLVLSQLTRPGAPFITTGWGASALDMRTTVSPYTEPEKQFIAQELAHHLHLPMFAFGGFSDSKTLDQQAGAEAALTIMTNLMAGSGLVHDVGYLESGLTYSLPLLAICNELIDWARTALNRVEISPETLALDVIEQVGPDGDFMGTDHTLAHFRQRWYPSLIERGHYDGWLEKGGLDLGQRAARRVEEILSAHHPNPLPKAVQAHLQEIADRDWQR